MAVKHVYSFEKLDAMRERRALTWYRLAKECGVRVTTLTPFALSRSEPKAHRLLDIARVLECDISDFFDVIEEQLDSSPKRKPSARDSQRRPSTPQKKDSS